MEKEKIERGAWKKQKKKGIKAKNGRWGYVGIPDKRIKRMNFDE